MKANQLRKLVKFCIAEVITEKTISDPAKEEMLSFLQKQFGREKGFLGDAEEAIYWFANFNHGGQWTNLYSILSTSPFSPGPIARGPEKNSASEMMYQALESEFGGGNSSELREINAPKPDRLSAAEKNQISRKFAASGLDGNGRFEKVEQGLAAVTNALSSLGFNLDMVSKDMIMGDKGSRMFIFRRKNDDSQDPFTEKSEIPNSRIVFNWERLDGPTSQYPTSPNKFEILAYAS